MGGCKRANIPLPWAPPGPPGPGGVTFSKTLKSCLPISFIPWQHFILVSQREAYLYLIRTSSSRGTVPLWRPNLWAPIDYQKYHLFAPVAPPSELQAAVQIWMPPSLSQRPASHGSAGNNQLAGISRGLLINYFSLKFAASPMAALLAKQPHGTCPSLPTCGPREAYAWASDSTALVLRLLDETGSSTKVSFEKKVLDTRARRHASRALVRARGGAKLQQPGALGPRVGRWSGSPGWLVSDRSDPESNLSEFLVPNCPRAQQKKNPSRVRKAPSPSAQSNSAWPCARARNIQRAGLFPVLSESHGRHAYLEITAENRLEWPAVFTRTRGC